MGNIKTLTYDELVSNIYIEYAISSNDSNNYGFDFLSMTWGSLTSRELLKNLRRYLSYSGNLEKSEKIEIYNKEKDRESRYIKK